MAHKSDSVMVDMKAVEMVYCLEHSWEPTMAHTLDSEMVDPMALGIV
jgi:hypothetical protein